MSRARVRTQTFSRHYEEAVALADQAKVVRSDVLGPTHAMTRKAATLHATARKRLAKAEKEAS